MPTPAQRAAATRKRRRAAAKAALTRKRRVAGRKAAATRKRRSKARRTSHDRIKALHVAKEMAINDCLRTFYFDLPERDLQVIWNDGENDLPADEQKLVRIAIRNKLGIQKS